MCQVYKIHLESDANNEIQECVEYQDQNQDFQGKDKLQNIRNIIFDTPNDLR